MNNFVLEFEKPIFELESKINELEKLSESGEIGLNEEIIKMREKASALRDEVFSNLTRWQCVQLARHPKRPYTLDYIERITTDFNELHGDRNFRDDEAIVAGLARLGSHKVAVIGQQKGRGTKENLRRNFAMPHPEGYRKALRIMQLAEKFNLPVVTLIDTPGAYPGLGAEERGQAAAIAENLFAMAQLKVPIIAVVIGEGGSGGALALGVADRVYMMQYAVYSVITPEGCASILYRDASHAQTAAEAMKMTARDASEHKLIDEVIAEPVGGAQNNYDAAATEVENTINSALDELTRMDPELRISERIEKYRRMGRWIEN